MCWLIFAGVSGYRGDLKNFFSDHGLVTEPSGNPVCESMDPSATRLAISDGHSACALYPQAGWHEPLEDEQLRDKYRKKGWSPSKIASAVDARLVSEARRLRKRAESNPFPGAIARLIETSSQVSLLAHHFHGSFDKPFPITRKQTMSPAAFVEDGGRFPADTLVTMFGYVR
jgi:hypothetical protein